MPVFLPLLLALQVTPVAPIVKGTALPPPGDSEAAVLAPLNALLAAIDAHDAAAAAATLRADGVAVMAIEGTGGATTIQQMRFSELPARLAAGTGKVAARLGTPAIEMDGDVAMVWAPYTMRIDGRIDHCGTNHASLVREGGVWKIAALSWSVRKTGCEAQ